MDLSPQHIAYKKNVGTMDGNPVMELATTGGLHLIVGVNPKTGKFETLGAGPHRAIARHIAKKRAKSKIEWNELAKSEDFSPDTFQDLLPEYESLTDQIRARQGL